MAERRVADVVGQGDGFGQVFVQPQPAGDGAGDLRDFERVREPGAVVVVDAGDEDLRLAGHAAEGGAVDDPLAVALVERCGTGAAVRGAGGRGCRGCASRRGRASRPRARASRRCGGGMGIRGSCGRTTSSSRNRSYSASSDCAMTCVSADHRHEVRVAVPARDDVPVQVARQPGPGDRPRFSPTLNPSGFIRFSSTPIICRSTRCRSSSFVGRQFVEPALVAERGRPAGGRCCTGSGSAPRPTARVR